MLQELNIEEQKLLFHFHPESEIRNKNLGHYNDTWLIREKTRNWTRLLCPSHQPNHFMYLKITIGSAKELQLAKWALTASLTAVILYPRLLTLILLYLIGRILLWRSALFGTWHSKKQKKIM